MHKRHRYQSGFTLVEIVLSTALFSIFMVGVVGSFAAIMKVHEHSIATRDAQSNGRFALEDISRLIRNAAEACISYSGDTCNKGTGSTLVLDRWTTIALSGDALVIRRPNLPDRALNDTQAVRVADLAFTVPNVGTPYVRLGFNVRSNVAVGVGPEWQINQGNGIALGTTVELRNGGSK